jgi:hypothetical protein
MKQNAMGAELTAQGGDEECTGSRSRKIFSKEITIFNIYFSITFHLQLRTSSDLLPSGSYAFLMWLMNPAHHVPSDSQSNNLGRVENVERLIMEFSGTSCHILLIRSNTLFLALSYPNPQTSLTFLI